MTEIEELKNELLCKGGPKKGQYKAKADPAKRARLEELIAAEPAAVEAPAEPEKGSLEQQLADANARATVAENEANRVKRSLENLAGSKVGNVNKPEGEILPRPDEVMARDLATVGAKAPEELTEQQKIAIEREIRRYVRRGYIMRSDKPVQLEKGYKDKISDADKSRANHLLKMLGRVDKKGNPILLWDESIVVPGFN